MANAQYTLATTPTVSAFENIAIEGKSKSTFVFIDVLRAIAALMVVVYHVIELGAWKEFPIQGPWLTFRIGWVGVDLFFVISGFVIAHSAVRDYQRNQVGFQGRFFARRLARIAPLYFLTCLVFLFLVKPEILFASPENLSAHILSHLLFVHNLHPETHGSINGPNWSVALEMQFYVAMIIAIPWLSRRRPWVVLSLLPVAIFYRYLTTLIVAPDAGSNAHLQHVLSSFLPGTLDEFAAGILLALLVNDKSARSQRYLKAGWRNFISWSAIFTVMLTITMIVYWPRASYWDNAYMITVWRTLLGISLACLVASAVTFPGASWPIFAPLRYLGEISYGIYLWHLPVLLTMLSVPGLSGKRLLAYVLTGTIALASFSWHLFEKPIVKRFRHATI